MKIGYLEMVRNRTALSRNMYCPGCGGHEYNITEQLYPYEDEVWRVECPNCGYETNPYAHKEYAILEWRDVGK